MEPLEVFMDAAASGTGSGWLGVAFVLAAFAIVVAARDAIVWCIHRWSRAHEPAEDHDRGRGRSAGEAHP